MAPHDITAEVGVGVGVEDLQQGLQSKEAPSEVEPAGQTPLCEQ